MFTLSSNMIIYEIVANLFILGISLVMIAVGAFISYVVINEIIKKG